MSEWDRMALDLCPDIPVAGSGREYPTVIIMNKTRERIAAALEAAYQCGRDDESDSINYDRREQRE